jgi:hypothetical protein
LNTLVNLESASPGFDGQFSVGVNNARQKIETWRQDYNNFRPHSALSDTAPALFARQFTASPNSRNL